MTEITKVQYFQIGILMLLILCGTLTDNVFAILLPSIKNNLDINITLSQWLFSTGTLGFALGMLFWGQLADALGRKNAWNIGMLLYITTIISGSYCQNATVFLVIRFVQGFSGSVSNVMALVVVRDWFPQTNIRSKVHAIVNQSFAFGPLLGFVISTIPMPGSSWRYTYLALAAVYIPIWIMLQQLHFKSHKKMGHFSLKETFQVLHNKDLLRCCILIGICISVGLCYLSHMPYILKNNFELPHIYPLSLVPLGLTWFTSGILAIKLPKYFSITSIFYIATWNLLLCSLAMIIIALSPLPLMTQAVLYLTCSISSMFGTGIIISHAIGMGLAPFGQSAGKAAAVLGCSYYLISVIMQNLLASMPHNTILPMPILMIVLSTIMLYLIRQITPSSTGAVDKTVENSSASIQGCDHHGTRDNLTINCSNDKIY